MRDARSGHGGGFRALLVLGAIVSVAVGVWGLSGGGILRSVLGLGDTSDDAFDAIARMYGGMMMTLGLAYVLAALHPHRRRGMLAVLFAAPFLTAMTVIWSVSRGQASGLRGTAFAVYHLAFCLLFFRMYPRLEDRPADQLPDGAPPVT